MEKVYSSKLKVISFGVMGFFVFAILWNIISAIENTPAMPSFIKIIDSFFKILREKDFYKNIFSTIKIVFISTLVAFVVSMLLAIICDLIKPISLMAKPLLDFFRVIPAIALFPLFLVLFGIKDISREMVIFWTAMPPMFLSTIKGMRDIDKSIIEAAKLDGANQLKIILSIKIPISVTSVLNGLKIGLGTGFISVVSAEMLGASKGIGYMILWNTNSFNYPKVYSYIIVIALIGLIINIVLDIIIKKLERR